MLEKVLSKEAKGCLALLKEAKVLKNFYLAGRTGLALQLQHRTSVDLDFFSSKKFNLHTLIQKLKKTESFSLEREEEDTLIVFINKVKVSFFVYDYPLLYSPKKIEGISVADARDIGCMKISAISSRGSKKDFVDLFFICQKITPSQLFLICLRKNTEELIII